MGLFPKNPCDYKVTVPKESQISNLSYGYLLVTQGENFTRWHSDFTEATDCLSTLYGQGEKFWYFAPPGSVAKQLEDGYIFAYQFKNVLNNIVTKSLFVSNELGTPFISRMDGYTV